MATRKDNGLDLGGSISSAEGGVGFLNARSLEIFRHVVEAYVETGEPIGSRTLSRRLGMVLSPATIRNVMSDLEESGLLFSPHTSAGRLPTDAGLRLFVDGLLEVGGDLSEDERASIEGKCATVGRSLPDVLAEASEMLSGLSQCAGLVVSPKSDAPLKHIEFVPLSEHRALVVMVSDAGMVENRVIDVPPGLPAMAFEQATNYLNAQLSGRTVAEAVAWIEQEMVRQRTELDGLTAKLVESGLAVWAGGGADKGASGASLILRGQSKLLEEVSALEDLERVRRLFELLERKDSTLRLLEATGTADGVQIFIGSENNLFDNTGCSMIIAPYADARRRVVGAIGVIGPMRMNYARIIPMVDYTSRLIGRMLD